MLAVGFGVSTIETQLPSVVYALLSGLNAATVGLVALAAVQLAERAISNNFTRILVCTTACLGLLYKGTLFPFFP
jgi:chromate transport protein ChrA